jgi:hypothetical protein
LSQLLQTTNASTTVINASSNVGGSRVRPRTGMRTGFVILGRRVIDVSLPNASLSYVLGMNDANDAVGYAIVSDVPRAILWRQGRTIDLNELPEVKAAGYTLIEARDINASGAIVCKATRGSTLQTVLLIPKTAP